MTDEAGTYVDGTLGGGGHTAALLARLGDRARVIGIDQDEDALRAAKARLADEVARGRLLLRYGNFGRLGPLLADEGIDQIDGLLLDLGVSSHQLDVPARGFSYNAEGDLDMRMDTRGGISAFQVVNMWPPHELRQALRDYGEEPRAGRIAQAIVKARQIRTTADLASVIRRTVPPPDAIKTLSRVFQAIRIAVNDELRMLERALRTATDVIRPGGRIAVISYHSLEDRRVKRFLRYGNFEGQPMRDLYGGLIAPFEELERGPIEASEEEVRANPRARSARLRIAERRHERTTPNDDDD